MRKTNATKKSDTIAYQLNPRFDLQGEATEKNLLMGVSFMPITPVTTKEMTEKCLRPSTGRIQRNLRQASNSPLMPVAVSTLDRYYSLRDK